MRFLVQAVSAQTCRVVFLLSLVQLRVKLCLVALLRR